MVEEPPSPNCPPCKKCIPGPDDSQCKERCDKYFSPLVISLNGKSIEAAEKSVAFKIDPKAKKAKYRWIKFAEGQGLLAYDFNKNGKIDDGSELFGNFTNGKSYKNGYIALAEMADKNKDKLISDTELKGLLLWQDFNLDGISEASEIKTLTELGITELDAGKNLSDKKLVISDGLYAKPHSEAGVKSLVDGKVILGKSWDIWIEQLLEKDKDNNSKKISLNDIWNGFVKLFQKSV